MTAILINQNIKIVWSDVRFPFPFNLKIYVK